jgi:hypothetical protein
MTQHPVIEYQYLPLAETESSRRDECELRVRPNRLRMIVCGIECSVQLFERDVIQSHVGD